MTEKKLIKNACILTMDKELGDYTNADLLIENSKIVKIGKDIAPDNARVINAQGMIALPGFVDCHRHVWQTNLRHLACDWSLSEYLLTVRALYADAYQAKDIFLGNYAGCLEALNSGVTTVVDHAHNISSPENADAAISGTMKSKIRSVFCYGMGDVVKNGKIFDSFATPRWHFDDFLRVSRRYFSDKNGRVTLGIALNELPFSNIEAITEEINFARDLGAQLVTFHLSTPDKEHIKELSAAGLLDSDMLVTHGFFMSDDELELLSKSGASVVATLESELQMGMGYGITSRAIEHGVNHSLGIDIVSNNSGDLFNQMRLSLQTQRGLYNHGLHKTSQTVKQLTTKVRDVLETATIGGARAAGLESQVGSLTPGKEADIILVNRDALEMQPEGDPYYSVVMYASRENVDTVIVGGDVVKQNGQLLGIDKQSLIQDLQQSNKALMSRVSQTPQQSVDDLKAMGLPDDFLGRV